MGRRFMLLYRHFRRRKYGEPIPKPKKVGQDSDELEDLFKDDNDMLERIKGMLQQRFDMDTIAEAKKQDEVDEISDFGAAEDNDQAPATKENSVTTKEEAREHVTEQIESAVVADILRDYLRKMIRVQGFLLTIVLSKRHKKKVKAIRKI